MFSRFYQSGWIAAQSNGDRLTIAHERILDDTHRNLASTNIGANRSMGTCRNSRECDRLANRRRERA